jgi:bifunctional non-homologous end joining protein LigD
VVAISNSNRIVFPEVGRTKGDVVRYYERIAPRILEHVVGRPLSIRRFPKGLAAPGFFQKNVPPFYPESIERLPLPKSKATAKRAGRKASQEPDVTVYPLVREPEHLAYLANQGAIELHVPTARVPDLHHPDRIVIDLDPPAGAFELVRRTAHLVKAALADLGLRTAPVATGSKGYHVVAAIMPRTDVDTLAVTLQKLALLLEAKHPNELTTAFRVAQRGKRVFVDWLRNNAGATVVAPFSLRARPRATVATPLTWEEVPTTSPDAFTIDDLDRLLDRPDPLADLAKDPSDPRELVEGVATMFDASGLSCGVPE